MCPKLQLAQLYLVRMAGHLFHQGVATENRDCFRWDSVSPTHPQDMNIAIQEQKKKENSIQNNMVHHYACPKQNKMDNHLYLRKGIFSKKKSRLWAPPKQLPTVG